MYVFEYSGGRKIFPTKKNFFIKENKILNLLNPKKKFEILSKYINDPLNLCFLFWIFKLSIGKPNLILFLILNGSKNVKYINFRIGVWNILYFSEKFKILSTNIVEPTVPQDIMILSNLKFIFFLLSVNNT